MKVRRFVLSSILAIFASFICFNAYAATFYVPADYPTIQDAIDITVTGDRILVAAGTYYEHLDFKGKLITLRSISGPEATVISKVEEPEPEPSPPIVTFINEEPAGTLIEGFTIRGGYSARGAGMYIDNSSPTIKNCIFLENKTYHAGGALSLVRNSFSEIINCVFIRNTGSSGGGVCTEDNAVPTLKNCSFSENRADVGPGGAIASYGNSSFILTNSIVWNNSPNEISAGSTAPIITYSDIKGGWAGEGNIDLDPLFVDSENNNLHLSLGSPCVDAGTNDAELADTDFEGDIRIIDGDEDGEATVDMGADEFKLEPDIEVAPLKLIKVVPQGQTAMETLFVYNHGTADLVFLVWDWAPWLTLEPQFSLVAPGEMVEVQVIFNATGLDPKVYLNKILVISTDPDEANVSLWVGMKVIE